MKTGTFNEGELLGVKRPPRLLAVYEGNQLMLASGGPKMIVIEEQTDPEGIVRCWIEPTAGESPTRMDIAMPMLTCFGAK